MSRKGNCYDNGPMESFFGKMKSEMFYGHEKEFNLLKKLQKAMEEYINYYNKERIQVKLKGQTPCEIRNLALDLTVSYFFCSTYWVHIKKHPLCLLKVARRQLNPIYLEVNLNKDLRYYYLDP